jgi:multiple sugar transport system substrate-binding protein
MIRKKSMVLAASAIAMGLALTGCSGGKSEQTAPSAKAELDQTPVTLTMMTLGSGISDEEFKTMIADPVKAKYPFITVEYRKYQQGENFEGMITAGFIPDLIYSGILDVPVLQNKNMQLDLNPLIKKYDVNLSDFESSTIDMIKRYGDKGQMYSMPFSLGFPIVLYNKDIFDRFGITYPKDGMTWQETIELARKVTKTVDGTSYKGFGMMAAARLSLTMLQEKYEASGKAKLTTDDWKQAMDIYRQLRTIPGNEGNPTEKMFRENKNVAMMATFNGGLGLLEDSFKAGDVFNWDMVTFPSMPGKPLEVDTPLQIMSISAQSKYPDQAFQVLKAITSKENQLAMSKAARPAVLKDDAIKKAFGQDYASLKGKNIAAPFKYKHQPINRGSVYDSLVNPEINKAADEMVKGEKDVNTALREAEERANKAIASYSK